jgi:ferritin
MLSDKMLAELNEQINKEIYSAYLYMAMSAQAKDMGLNGFANWFMVQFHEEMYHAMKMYEYVQQQGGRVELKAIQQPPGEFESPLDMFTKTLEHEQFVTRSINNLMDIAIAEKDHATQIFLQWYVTEQVEEEDNDNEIINQLKMVEGHPHGLMMIDRELGSRAAHIPTDFSKGLEAAESAA